MLSKPHALAALIVAVLLPPLAAGAHTPSDSYLTLRPASEGLEGRWDLALKDLDFALGLDGDKDGAVTWRELAAAEARVSDYAFSHLEVRAGGEPCTARPRAQQVARHADETYAVLLFSLRCPAGSPSALDIDYSPFFHQNPGHRGFLVVEGAGPARTAVFRPGDASLSLALAADASSSEAARSAFGTFLVEGVWHVLIGFDHILFLLALLLPSVLRREGSRWEARAGLRPVLGDVLAIVTAFTVAHSITLALATTGVSRLPSVVVESGIAISVVLVALNNVLPVFKGDRWTMTFALGLLHGFGFSSVLLELGLPQASRAWPLLGFNLGVEVGQLAIVAAFLPIAYALRRSWLYQRVLLLGGSLAIAFVALLWSVERMFDVSFVPQGGFLW